MIYFLDKSLNKKRDVKKKNYREAREPQSQNKIYKIDINCFGCLYCHPKKGRKKKFKKLWDLHMHNTREHPTENHRELTMNLADLLIKGILIK